MYIDLEQMTTKAKEMGAKSFGSGVYGGEVRGFPDRRSAEEFTRWLSDQGVDHRGAHRDGESFYVRLR